MNLEPELIQACLRSDRRAQSELYSRCYSLLMGICMRYLKDEQEASAMVNQGFFKILNSLDKRNPHAPLEAWMRRIMINTVIDEFRRQRRHRETISYEYFGDSTHYEDFVDYNEADRRLDAAEIETMVQQLPDVSRQVFNLYAIDGYSHKEISEWLGISVGTSKWHVSHARKQLKIMISQHLNHSKKHSL
jgi:RNA polymerase sigma factor (sigma-70 family)